MELPAEGRDFPLRAGGPGPLSLAISSVFSSLCGASGQGPPATVISEVPAGGMQNAEIQVSPGPWGRL